MIYRDQLEKVYALIEKPENWTQGAFARSADGDDLCDEDSSMDGVNSSSAACWCIWGAAFRCGIPERADIEFVTALGFKQTFEPNTFNDTHTHAEVLALLKSAIDRAPVREGAV